MSSMCRSVTSGLPWLNCHDVIAIPEQQHLLPSNIHFFAFSCIICCLSQYKIPIVKDYNVLLCMLHKTIVTFQPLGSSSGEIAAMNPSSRGAAWLLLLPSFIVAVQDSQSIRIFAFRTQNAVLKTLGCRSSLSPPAASSRCALTAGSERHRLCACEGTARLLKFASRESPMPRQQSLCAPVRIEEQLHCFEDKICTCIG